MVRFCAFIVLSVLAGCNPGVPEALPTLANKLLTTREATTPSLTETTLNPAMGDAPTATRCAKEISWKDYIVQVGDTLDLIAELADTTKEALMAANCLIREKLTPGDHLYTPVSIPEVRITQPPLATCIKADEACKDTLRASTPIPTLTCRAGDESCHEGSVIRRLSPTPWSIEQKAPIHCSPFDSDCLRNKFGN